MGEQSEKLLARPGDVDAYALLQRVARAVSAALPLDQTLGAVAALLPDALGAMRARAWLTCSEALPAPSDVVELAAARLAAPEDDGQVRVDPRRVAVLHQPELRELVPEAPAQLDFGTLVLVPLLHAERRVGTLALEWARPVDLDARHRELLETVGVMVALAAEQARLADLATHQADALVELGRDRRQAATSYELVAEALDTASALLAGLRRLAQRYAAHGPRDELGQGGLPELGRLAEEARRALEAGLRAAALVPRGPDLVPALHDLAAALAEVLSCHVPVHVEGEPPAVSFTAARAVYLTAYRAVVGGVRYARARVVSLALTWSDDELQLTTADDGRKLTLRHAGRKGYEELAVVLADAGGSLVVENAKRGVCLRVRCPIGSLDTIS